MLALLIIPSLIGVSLMGSLLGLLDFPILGSLTGSGVEEDPEDVAETEQEETTDLLDTIGLEEESAPTDGEDSLDGEVPDGEGEEAILEAAAPLMMQGGDESETIDGDTGADTLRGGNGDDTLNGSDGNDMLVGQSGNDAIYGHNDADVIWAGWGDDFADGGAGNDSISGMMGSDTLWGGEGDDSIHGGDGDDVLAGDAGADSVFGGEGADLVNGGDGADWLMGGTENDTILGGEGADTLLGDAGHDVLSGTLAMTLEAFAKDTDTTADKMHGGAGKDTFFVNSGDIACGDYDADTFDVLVREDGAAVSYLIDFDPAEDEVVAVLPEGYAGAGEVTIEDIATGIEGAGMVIVVDGNPVAALPLGVVVTPDQVTLLQV